MADVLHHEVGTAPDGTAYDYVAVEADWRPTKVRHEAWAQCARCDHVAPRSEMQLVSGQWRCLRYGCASEGPLGTDSFIRGH
jgi:hypothetical protein